MTKAVANKPWDFSDKANAIDPIQRNTNLDTQHKHDAPGSRDESYDGSDENDKAIERLVDDRGALGEDMDLNDGNSAYSDQPSNGPRPKNWPADE